MLEVEQVDDVVKIRMARAFFGKSVYFTTSYYIDGLLVDTGCNHVSTEYLKQVQNLKINTIVNTHSHEDHIGNNHALQNLFKPEVFAHEKAIQIISNPEKLRLKRYQKLVWGTPKPSAAKKLGASVETENFDFEVTYTPGHSDDHVCLFEKMERWMFTGDTFIGGRDRVLRSDSNIYKIIDSLKRINSYHIKLLFSGSGTVLSNPRDAISEKIEYLENLGKKILKQWEECRSINQIKTENFGRERLMYYVTQGHYSAKNLVVSYIKDKPL